MRIFGLAGWSGSGKTTLLVGLIPELVQRGLRVSTLKHAHHAFDLDQPGKDSYRHREAGACEVMIASATRWALMHEHRQANEPDSNSLIAHMNPVDLLLIEGFKRDPHPKLEIYRPSLGKPLLQSKDPHIVVIASDVPQSPGLAGLSVPVLDLNDHALITDFICTHIGLESNRKKEPDNV